MWAWRKAVILVYVKTEQDEVKNSLFYTKDLFFFQLGK